MAQHNYKQLMALCSQNGHRCHEFPPTSNLRMGGPHWSCLQGQDCQQPKHWHHSGCPAYTLFQGLQMDTSIYHVERQIQGWSLFGVVRTTCKGCKPCSEPGLGLPQFHVKLDSTFQALREEGIQVPPSQWQHKCSFAAKGPCAKGTVPVAEEPTALPLPNSQYLPQRELHHKAKRSEGGT